MALKKAYSFFKDRHGESFTSISHLCLLDFILLSIMNDHIIQPTENQCYPFGDSAQVQYSSNSEQAERSPDKIFP